MNGEGDEAKNAFKKLVIRKLIPSYLSDKDIEEIKNVIKIDNNITSSENGLSAEDLAD